MGEMIVNAAKMALRIALMAGFMVAIASLISLITSITFNSVFSELIGILSMCLPFDVNAVMSAIGLSISAILAFLISNKIYHLSQFSAQ